LHALSSSSSGHVFVAFHRAGPEYHLIEMTIVENAPVDDQQAGFGGHHVADFFGALLSALGIEFNLVKKQQHTFLELWLQLIR
jgi:hypothetical protein